MKISAYADDVSVIDHSDVQFLKDTIEQYGKASSARMNWSKSNALWCGQAINGPMLPGSFQWGKMGFKYLGFFF